MYIMLDMKKFVVNKFANSVAHTYIVKIHMYIRMYKQYVQCG